MSEYDSTTDDGMDFLQQQDPFLSLQGPPMRKKKPLNIKLYFLLSILIIFVISMIYVEINYVKSKKKENDDD